QESTLDLNSEIATRRAKLAALREEGIVFANDFSRGSISGDMHAAVDDNSTEEREALGTDAVVVGRTMTRRLLGEAAFVTLQDMSDQIKLYLSRAELTEGVYNEKFKKWDMDDIIGARGQMIKTQTGETTIHCSNVRLLTKPLRPLPAQCPVLSAMEMSYRQS
ncbi:lysine--tRNA ligase, partial [Plesiomonas shigelloides]|nr:lysine--tRNA ligase [Plesiomonas shigelloides]